MSFKCKNCVNENMQFKGVIWCDFKFSGVSAGQSEPTVFVGRRDFEEN